MTREQLVSWVWTLLREGKGVPPIRVCSYMAGVTDKEARDIRRGVLEQYKLIYGEIPPKVKDRQKTGQDPLKAQQEMLKILRSRKFKALCKRNKC